MYMNHDYRTLNGLNGLFLRIPAIKTMVSNEWAKLIREAGEGVLARFSPKRTSANTIELVQELMWLNVGGRQFLAYSFPKDVDANNSFNLAMRYIMNKLPDMPELLAVFMDHALKGKPIVQHASSLLRDEKDPNDLIYRDGDFIFRRGQEEEDKELVPLMPLTEYANIQDALKSCAWLLTHLESKDVFELKYKTLLAARLLSRVSLKDVGEAEANTMTYLKRELGVNSTRKMEGMFKDMQLSASVHETWEKDPKHEELCKKGFSLNVKVLTTGLWPNTGGDPSIVFPPVCLSAFQAYTTMYLGLHVGRKLTLQPHMGYGVVQWKVGDKVYDLVVSTFQMCILEVFNTHSLVSCEDLQGYTNIPMVELKRHLVSLTTRSARVLMKTKVEQEKEEGSSSVEGVIDSSSTSDPTTPTTTPTSTTTSSAIKNTDTFFINLSFKSKLRRVKVPLAKSKGVAKSKESKQSEGMVPQQVVHSRKLLVESSIVRVMKSRGVITHALLVGEVIKQVSAFFVPTPQEIKTRIESLIERDYMERSEDHQDKYEYVK